MAMKLSGKLLAVCIVVGLAVVLFVVYGFDRLREDREGSTGEKLALTQVPLAVRATIEQESKDGTVKEIEKLTKGSETVYGADIVVNGQEREVIVAEDGKVIERGKKEEDDDD
jgi:hypothetical protein